MLYYLINYFKINENYKIKCFYNFYVIKHGLKNQFFKYIFIKTMFKLSLGISKYYKFLKCEEIVVPIFDEIKYSNQIKKNYTKVKNKNKLIVFKLNGILIGDLIYDCYLTRFSEPTINIKSKNFRDFFKNLIFILFLV